MEHAGGRGSGTGEVHGHLGNRPGPEPERSRADRTSSGESRFESPLARARRLAEGPLKDVRGRAESMASQTRDRAGRLLSDSRGRLEGTRVLTVIQENPVMAVAAAFALGFLLAGRSDATRGFGKKKQQLRGAIVGAAAAALAEEARDLLATQGGLAGLLGGLFSSETGPLDEDEEDEEGGFADAEEDDALDYYAAEEEDDEEYDADPHV